MKRTLLLTVLTAFLILPLAAQQGTVSGTTGVSKIFREAEMALLDHDYKKAIRLFERCLKTHPNLAAAHRGIGLSYSLLNDYEEAARAFNMVIEIDSMFSRVIYFEAGEANYKVGDYDKAFEYFQRFDSLQAVRAGAFGYHGDREKEAEKEYLSKLDASLRACQMAMDSAKFQGIKEIINIGRGINTKSDEYFPCLSNDQQLMFYTTRRHDRADEDLFFSTQDDDGWKRGSPLGAFNTNKNEGMSTLVRNNRTMFFTACGREGVLGTCDIWEADIEHLQIKRAGALDGYSNSPNWESQAAISCDGSTLYFASNREGGFGGTDIWYSRQLADGRWSDPINLGPRINTHLDEEAPFITNDSKTLYFASTGHPGMGEQDIFVSWLNHLDQWSVPINLGPPVNTAYRELGFFLSADGQTGYFASNRPGGEGGMDIYKFQLSDQLHSDPITFVEGRVRDSLLNEPVVTTAQVTGRGGIRTDEEGRFFLCIPAGKELQVLIEEENYHPYRIRIPVPEWDNREPFVLDINLSPIRQFAARSIDTTEATAAAPKPKVEKEQSCMLFFPFDSDKLEIKESNRLDEFMQSLEGKEVDRVEIIGYADDIGADQYNMKLSEERAKKIALFMREYGVIVHKIYLEGRGEIKDNQPKFKNRRVEVRVVTLEEL